MNSTAIRVLQIARQLRTSTSEMIELAMAPMFLLSGWLVSAVLRTSSEFNLYSHNKIIKSKQIRLEKAGEEFQVLHLAF